MTSSSSVVALFSSLFLSLFANLLLTISCVAIDMHLYLWLVQLLSCFFLLLIYFPSAFLFGVCCINNIKTIFAIIQCDGGILYFRKPYHPINPTQFYIGIVGCLVFSINIQQYISPFALKLMIIVFWKTIMTLLSTYCCNIVNTKGF